MKKLLFFLLIPAMGWGDEVHKTAGTVTTAGWTGATVANLNTANDVRATHQNTDGLDSIYLTNFSMAVPTGATIDSIWIGTQGQGSATQSARRRIVVAATKNGTSAAGENSAAIVQDQDSDTDNETTGNTDQLFNTTWTVAEINASTFGVIIRNNVTQAGVVEVDSVSIRVVYTPAGGDIPSRRNRLLRSSHFEKGLASCVRRCFR